MGTIAASIIILALIFYALKDLLIDRDFSAWTNMAITSLILFTVILSIFMVLNKKEDVTTSEKKPAAVQEETTDQQQSSEELSSPNPAAAPEEEMSDEEAMLAIAKEYVAAEADCNKNAPKGTGCSDAASNYIISKYNFTDTEWQAFLQTAATEDLFNKARADNTADKVKEQGAPAKVSSVKTELL